jgi:transcriptional regulator with XRE-family HTH domain
MSTSRIGHIIRAYRTQRELTLEDVALQTNMTHQYLSRLERNERTPTLLTLHRLDCVLRFPDKVLLAFIRQACCGGPGGGHAHV